MMNNTKLKVQKCGSRWRIIIDGTKAEPVLIDFSTPYEELKRELGISNRQSEKSRRENGPMGFGENHNPAVTEKQRFKVNTIPFGHMA